MNSKIWSLAILLILPSIFLFVGTNFSRAIYAGDPDYIYLMNAINLARGKDAGHIDNPGTPVMEIGSGLLYMHHLLDQPNKDTLQETVLKDPERFVKLIRQFILLLITLVFIFTGWVVYSKTGSIWIALIFQITPFLSINLLEVAWTKLSPEAVLLFVVTIYAAILVWFYKEQSNKTHFYLILFSIFGGLGLATKATFLPLLIIPFFLFKNWKTRLFYSLGTIAAFFFFTFPAHKEYKNMFRWFNGLITHKGMYGGGESGLIDISEYLNAIEKILSNNLYWSVILLLAVIVYVVHFLKFREKGSSKSKQILLALIAANFLGILMVAKHYLKNHYLLPELALTGVTLFFAMETLDDLIRKLNWKSIFSIIFLSFVVVVFAVSSVPVLQSKNHGHNYTNSEYYEAQAFIEKNYPYYLNIYYYPDGLNKMCALNFGNGYSKLANQEALNEIYPHAYFFNFISGSFEFWASHVPLEKIIEKYDDHIIITGKPIDDHGIKLLNSCGIYVRPVFKKVFQAVYEVDSVSTRMKSTFNDQYKRRIYCDAESLTNDGGYFNADGHRVEGLKYRTKERVRSGNHAFKIDKKTEYAIKLTIDTLFAGQDVECRIWRYQDSKDGALVVSADNSSLFYTATSIPSYTDSLGWQLIKLSFVVPDITPPIEKLNLYLWNKSNETVYFDDLEVILK